MLDSFDLRLVEALARDGSLSNVELSARLHLSASQCSRRRAALERAGVIRGYRAVLDYQKLGRGISAITRITLDTHSPDAANEFVMAVERLQQVNWAAVVTGDADYVLWIRVGSLEELADFINDRLLSQRAVRQVRSEVVLRTLKQDGMT